MKCGFFLDFHTTSGQKQWPKKLLVYRILCFFVKSIAEWGHGWVVHRWFENTILHISWFWREIYEFRKDHKMGYTEPFELAISRIDSPMSQLSSGKIIASNGALFGTLSTHFDYGQKISNFKKSSQIAQFYRILHIFYVFYRFFSKFWNRPLLKMPWYFVVLTRNLWISRGL